MPNPDEERIVKAIEQSIALSNEGASPNEAIQKVAEEQQFSAPFIARMVEGFNKSKSVHILKNAAESERAKPFELANTATIVAAIFPDDVSEKQEKVACEVPQQDFSRIDFKGGGMEKAAEGSPQPVTLPVHSFAARLEKYASFCGKVLETLSFNVAKRRRAFNKHLEKSARELQKLSPPQLKKVAQAVTNGYPETGPKLLKILRQKSRCHLPELEKTAHGVIFPSEEPFLSIANVYKSAGAWADACNAQAIFEKDAKEGAGMFRQFLQGEGEFGHVKTAAGVSDVYKSFAGSMLAGKRLGDEAAKAKKEEPLTDVLDPEVINRLQELEARKSLMQLMLYDEDLAKYETPEIVSAYNAAVSTVPEAYKHSAVLKNLMIQNLETGGVKDPFQLKQEADIGKSLAETEKTRLLTQKEEMTPELKR